MEGTTKLHIILKINADGVPIIKWYIDTKIKTKSEVIISSHKYAEKHFKSIGRIIAHTLIFISSFSELFIFSFFSKVKRGMFFIMLRYWFSKTTSIK